MKDWQEGLNTENPLTAELKMKPLIEKNTILLADLEREWSALGPLRSITYTIHFDDEDEARVFARETETLGFDTDLSSVHQSRDWIVYATRSMEPTVANVTYWEEWFSARVENWDRQSHECCRPRFEGWSYPRREAPAFSLEGRPWSNTSARERGQILFGQTLANDQVTPKGRFQYLGSTTKAPPFRIIPSQFLTKARARRPRHAEPTASKFAQWLYSLYADAYGNAQDREEGKVAEEAILAARRSAYTCIDANILSASFPDWQLIHNGMNTGQLAISDYFKIADLNVAGEALRVLPDLIYRSRRTGEIIIVEIKHSRMAIPSNLWPNIWGQLWCYAQLEQIREAPRVTVVGEVWGDAWTRRTSIRLVCLRASVRRNPRAPAYDRFFRALFDIYRGID
ncbi:ribonuclease E inhibitor RraB [Sphingomonas sp. QA11]|uniref:ribonuclease E inhibitor RraB n=1 Tax=Sphingomonas sp. QA11 TaxID=2950605 RepID=UPI002349C732|nr:ribonuclease E inhibitor RraB [Sphingomonas sp. QA11]WCM29172.1 ribonuclease E inhibitor RraB [Sphingomonas sp. QA11]